MLGSLHSRILARSRQSYLIAGRIFWGKFLKELFNRDLFRDITKMIADSWRRRDRLRGGRGTVFTADSRAMPKGSTPSPFSGPSTREKGALEMNAQQAQARGTLI